MSEQFKGLLSKRKKSMIRLVLSLLILCVVGTCMHFGKEIRSLKKKSKTYRQLFARLKEGNKSTAAILGGVTIPVELQNIPLAESTGLVLGVKKISIRNVIAPYNASIVEHGNGYLIFFRYDVIDQKCPYPFYTYIGCAELDVNFEQTEKEFTRIDTHSDYSEDPRIVKVGQEFYIVYNDLVPDKYYRRGMHIANLNIENRRVNFVTALDPQMQSLEKNWVPFAYQDENNDSHLFFEYYINPHRILNLENPKQNSLQFLTFPNISSFQRLFWPHIWGEPRGGSTARKIGDQYLAFFHCSFRDKEGLPWYFMGAYTFEDKPPFRITAMSNYPILFEGVFSSPAMNTANPRLRCLYPCGFAIENREGRELIHVSCGENDSATKVITLDKELLFKSMKKL
jgi:predicted GH43/DUF377 family glycosyl hydrolase